MSRNRNKREILIFLFWLLVIVNILWFGLRIVDYKNGGGETPLNVEDNTHSEIKESVFYYNQLSEDNQKSYEVLKQGLMERNDNIVLDNCSADDLKVIWDCVLMDSPEIFWVNSFRYLEHKGDIVNCEVLPDYCYTKDEMVERQEKIQEIAKEFIAGISKGESEYNKILYTYEYIIEQTEYNKESSNNQHIDSVFIAKSSVCAGYAKSTKYLLNLLGVECTYVTGTASNSEGEESHAWTIVTCEGDYYYVDTTWGDPLYDDNSNNQASNINYDYMCCNDEQLFKTHKLKAGYEYPSCAKLDCNYYVVNDRYFTDYNADEISELIKKDIEEGQTCSEFKFSDSDVYEKAKEDLLGKQAEAGKKLFNELNGTNESQYLYKDDAQRYKIAIYWD